MLIDLLSENKIIYNNEPIIETSELNEYIKAHPKVEGGRIYTNSIDDTIYSQYNTTEDEYSFFHSSTDEFLSSEQGLPLVAKQMSSQVNGKNKFWYKSEDLIQNDEFIISAENVDLLHSLNNKSCVLISNNKHTTEINYNDIISDYIMLMDNFYETDLINCTANIICVTGKTDVNDIRFKQYVREHNPLIIVEPATIDNNIQWFLNKYNDRIIYVHTRFHGNGCTLSRMLVVSILCGLRDIYYIGFEYNDDDYLLKSKTMVILYDYIFNTLMRVYSNVRLYNLAEGLDGDIGTGITSKYMKLNENIKRML